MPVEKKLFTSHTKYYYKELNGDFTTKWNRLLTLHREDGPAIMDYDYHGELFREEWFLDGKAHRRNGPAFILKTNLIDSKIEKWYIDGKLHREEGPAILNIMTSGTIIEERWYHHGNIHKDKAPAIIEKDYKTGFTKKESWFLNNKLHRDDGPAIIEYIDQEVSNEKWYLEDTLLEKNSKSVV